jgi:hypothetical protein
VLQRTRWRLSAPSIQQWHADGAKWARFAKRSDLVEFFMDGVELTARGGVSN